MWHVPEVVLTDEEFEELGPRKCLENYSARLDDTQFATCLQETRVAELVAVLPKLRMGQLDHVLDSFPELAGAAGVKDRRELLARGHMIYETVKEHQLDSDDTLAKYLQGLSVEQVGEFIAFDSEYALPYVKLMPAMTHEQFRQVVLDNPIKALSLHMLLISDELRSVLEVYCESVGLESELYNYTPFTDAEMTAYYDSFGADEVESRLRYPAAKSPGMQLPKVGERGKGKHVERS